MTDDRTGQTGYHLAQRFALRDRTDHPHPRKEGGYMRQCARDGCLQVAMGGKPLCADHTMEPGADRNATRIATLLARVTDARPAVGATLGDWTVREWTTREARERAQDGGAPQGRVPVACRRCGKYASIPVIDAHTEPPRCLCMLDAL